MKISTLVLGVYLLAIGTGSAVADTKYTYTGLTYNDVKAPYTAAMSLNGYIVLANDLPPNLTNTTIGPGSSYPISSWSFNDGVHSYTQVNSQLLAGISAGDPPRFTVSTDANGSITVWDLAMISPKGPHVIDQPLDAFFSNSTGGDIVVDHAKASCTHLDGSNCKQILGQEPTFSPASGSWSKDAVVSTVSLGKTVDKTVPAKPGDTLIYTITLKNKGNVGIPQVTVTDPAPAHIALGAWSCAGTNATCPNATGNGALNEVVPELPIGGALIYTINATVAPDAPSETTLTNTASVNSTSASVTCEGGAALPCSASASIITSAKPVVPNPTPTPVPTLGVWGLISLSSLLTLFGLVCSRRYSV